MTACSAMTSLTSFISTEAIFANTKLWLKNKMIAKYSNWNLKINLYI